VGGTSSTDRSLGIVQRSEDGGASWTTSSVELPPGSGSMFISAIDPSDPDRLWVRLPARGDRFGVLPVTLMMSEDKGESWSTLAATENQAMLGFALSPDGTQLAYGGPGDGLFVGASDGSEGFTKRSELRVRCLRWNADGLYACGTESINPGQPADPFSVGLSTDEGASFRAIYSMKDTCPAACAQETGFAMTCMDVWSALVPFLGASGEACEVPWARPQDGGVRDAGPRADASSGQDASTQDASRGEGSAAPEGAGGCGCHVIRSERTSRAPLSLALAALVIAWTRRRARLLIVALGVIGCGDGGEPADETEADAALYAACPESIPALEPGLTFTGRDERIRVEVLEASPLPARKYRNDWKLALTDAQGTPLDDVAITRLEAFMPVHGHYSRPPATSEPLDEPGRFDATIHFTMRGPWQVLLDASSASAGDDYLVLDVCVQQ
jgi:hypothetical protein